MRRGHVEKTAILSAPARPIKESTRRAPGMCPKCGVHVGRALRGHVLTCGVAPVAPKIEAPKPFVPTEKLLAPKPLVGPQPTFEKPDKQGMVSSPRLARLVHGTMRDGRPLPGRHRRNLSVAERQRAAVAQMRRNAGLT